MCFCLEFACRKELPRWKLFWRAPPARPAWIMSRYSSWSKPGGGFVLSSVVSHADGDLWVACRHDAKRRVGMFPSTNMPTCGCAA